MKHFKEFLENGKWKQMKKSDWIVLALTGVLLLVIALPAGGGERAGKGGEAGKTGENQALREEGSASDGAGQTDGARASGGEQDYVEKLEEKLEAVLAQADGVGRVEVMITVKDAGEHVVEKDSARSQTTTAETDSGGGTRTVTEVDTNTSAIFVETQDETYPYIQKEKMPAIEGVVVVAEGGGNPSVAADISETIKALFPIEAHRIKVVKMCSREESE